jgi:hypothetical protein
MINTAAIQESDRATWGMSSGIVPRRASAASPATTTPIASTAAPKARYHCGECLPREPGPGVRLFLACIGCQASEIRGGQNRMWLIMRARGLQDRNRSSAIDRARRVSNRTPDRASSVVVDSSLPEGYAPRNTATTCQALTTPCRVGGIAMETTLRGRAAAYRDGPRGDEGVGHE